MSHWETSSRILQTKTKKSNEFKSTFQQSPKRKNNAKKSWIVDQNHDIQKRNKFHARPPLFCTGRGELVDGFDTLQTLRFSLEHQENNMSQPTDTHYTSQAPKHTTTSRMSASVDRPISSRSTSSSKKKTNVFLPQGGNASLLEHNHSNVVEDIDQSTSSHAEKLSSLHHEEIQHIQDNEILQFQNKNTHNLFSNDAYISQENETHDFQSNDREDSLEHSQNTQREESLSRLGNVIRAQSLKSNHFNSSLASPPSNTEPKRRKDFVTSPKQHAQRRLVHKNSQILHPGIWNSFSEHSIENKAVEAEAYIREQQLKKLIDELRWKTGIDYNESPTPKKIHSDSGNQEHPLVESRKIEKSMISAASIQTHHRQGKKIEEDTDYLYSHEELVQLGIGELFIRRAIERYKLRKYERAESDVKLALALEFDAESRYCCYYLLGMCLYMRERFKDAIEANLKAIKIYQTYGLKTSENPNPIPLHEKYSFFTIENIYNNCALSYFSLDRYKLAYEMFDAALKCAETAPIHLQNTKKIRLYLYNKGCSLYYMHQLREAIHNFSLALSLQDKNEDLDFTVLLDILYMRSLCFRLIYENDRSLQDQMQIKRFLMATNLDLKFLSVCHFKYFGKRILLNIFSFLPISDLSSIAKTNKYWYQVIWSRPIIEQVHISLTTSERKARSWKVTKKFSLELSAEEQKRRSTLNPYKFDFIVISKKYSFAYLQSICINGVPIKFHNENSQQNQLSNCQENEYRSSLFKYLPSLRYLEMNEISDRSCNEVIRDISIHCKYLERLNLSKLNSKFKKSLYAKQKCWTFEHMKNLKYLNISKCRVQDINHLLTDIGINCEKLEKINIEGIHSDDHVAPITFHAILNKLKPAIQFVD